MYADNRKLQRLPFNKKGLTLIELIVASTIAAVVGLGIFFFSSFAGESIRDLLTRQQLQQESSYVAELFMREVRNGNFVAVTGSTNPPSDTVRTQTITIYNADKTERTRFTISGDTLLQGGAKMLSPYLCTYGAPSNFLIHGGGGSVDFFLSMDKMVGDRTFKYTQVIGGVRCKNGTAF